MIPKPSLIFCVALACLLPPNWSVAQEKDKCLGLEASQAEMNACEGGRLTKADAELNAVYRRLLAKYKSDADFVKKLRLAQEDWIKFRDANLASFYYLEDKPGAYGSVHPTCRAMILTDLTLRRTTELKLMLDPEEGDVCAFVAAQDVARNSGKSSVNGARCSVLRTN